MTNLPRTFDPHLHPQEIVLVGCGGSGGYIARQIARLLVHLRALRLNVPTFRIVDPDVVEAANVGRQLYTPAEIGLYKAETTARRLSCVFGLPIEWAHEPFNPDRHLSRARGAIVVDAVDSHTARVEIAKLVNTVVIACGNEAQHFQVSIGNTSSAADMARYLREVAQHERKLGAKTTLMYLPTAYALFPALLEPDPVPAHITTVPDASCAERLLTGEQDLYINDAVALVAARYVQQLLLRQPIQSFLTFGTLDETTVIKPVSITLDNLRAYLPDNG